MAKDQIKAYEEQLKPCPFCGGKARIENRFNWWWVACSNGRNKCKVDCHTIQFDSPDKAAEVWNKRFEFEEWHGMNGVTYAPKGTFEKIFNDPDDGEDI